MISSGHQGGLVCVCHQLPAKQAFQASCVLLGQYELIQGRCVFTMSYLSGQWLLINLAQDGTTVKAWPHDAGVQCPREW